MTHDNEELSAASAGSVDMANLATVDLFHAEITRLHGVNDRLRAEIERLRTMAFNPATLTDAERLAIQWIVGDALSVDGVSIQETLRGLLERLK